MAIVVLRCELAHVNCAWLEQAKDDVMVACVRLAADQVPILEQWMPVFDGCYSSDEVARIDDLQNTWNCNIRFAIPEAPIASVVDILHCTREAVLNGLQHGCVPAK